MMSEGWEPFAKVYDPLKAGSIDGTDTEPHDNAIIRALNAKYKPNKSVVGDKHKTVFVARLDLQTDEDQLWTAFRKFGKIKNCRLVQDVVTGFSKGYGFVEYEEEADAGKAYRHGNKMMIENTEVFVDYENERKMPGWIPRRLGGGVGGNKKSGQLRFGGRDRPFIKPIMLSVGNEDFGKDRETRFQDRRDHDSRYPDRDFGRESYDRDRYYRDRRRDDWDRQPRESRSRRERSRDRSRERSVKTRGGSRERDYDYGVKRLKRNMDKASRETKMDRTSEQEVMDESQKEDFQNVVIKTKPE